MCSYALATYILYIRTYVVVFQCLCACVYMYVVVFMRALHVCMNDDAVCVDACTVLQFEQFMCNT